MSVRSGVTKPLLPSPLLPGGTIGICAPAGPVKPERLERAIRAIAAEGYEVTTSPSAFAQRGLFAASDAVRRRELEEMFSREDVHAVFCARGGVGSSRLLETINTRHIAQSGKPLLGFSDVTVLQWLLWARERLVTFTGPLAVEWDGDLSERTQRQVFRMLGGTADSDLLADWPRDSIRVLRNGRKAAGRLLPGNLTMIATLLGTPYCPDLRGAILLVEDVNEPAHRVDRLLFHLRNAGVLGQISALLVGDLSGEGNGDNAEHSLLDATRGETYPVAMNLPYGHGPERMTLPVGGLVEFCSETMSLSLLEPVTRAAS